MKEPKLKKLRVKTAISIGEDILDRIRTAEKQIEDAKIYLEKVRLEQKELEKLCPHPKKYFKSFGFEYLHEFCNLCGYHEWF